MSYRRPAGITNRQMGGEGSTSDQKRRKCRAPIEMENRRGRAARVLARPVLYGFLVREAGERRPSGRAAKATASGSSPGPGPPQSPQPPGSGPRDPPPVPADHRTATVPQQVRTPVLPPVNRALASPGE